MCGISGAIEKRSKANLDFSQGSALHRCIQRRGPDFYGFKTIDIGEHKLTLAHSRLSIIDLSNASNQPFISFGGRYAIVFNGEIYNFIELKEELKGLGYTFSTTGDTEVLVSAWDCWGRACLHKFNGMFAFALYDSTLNEFYIVRDRFGVKPIVYTLLQDGGVFFSSSINSSVFVSENKTLDIDYLSRGYYYGIFEGIGDNTVYSSVKYLEAGTIATINLNGSQIFIEKDKWYNLGKRVEELVSQYVNRPYPNVKEECETLLKDSVNLRLRSDVPVAVSLSGGVDSTIIASLAQLFNPNIEGFNFGDPSNSKSEGVLVDKFAKNYGLKVNYISIPENREAVIRAFEETMEAQELPFLGLSIVAQNRVYNKVKEHGIRVLLGGQGGDEIFSGYRKFFIHALKNSVYNKNLGDSLSLLYSLGIMMTYETKKISLFWGFRNRYFNQDNLSTDLFSNFLPFNKIEMIGKSSASVSERQTLDIIQNSIPTLLRYEDRNSMYHSIESRLPMMDYRLVEFALSLPILFKIRNGYGKWILRDIYRNKIPNDILFNKRKRGFDVTQNLMKIGLQDYLVHGIFENKSKLEMFDIKINEKDIADIVAKPEHLRNNDLLFLNYLIRRP